MTTMSLAGFRHRATNRPLAIARFFVSEMSETVKHYQVTYRLEEHSKMNMQMTCQDTTMTKFSVDLVAAQYANMPALVDGQEADAVTTAFIQSLYRELFGVPLFAEKEEEEVQSVASEQAKEVRQHAFTEARRALDTQNIIVVSDDDKEETKSMDIRDRLTSHRTSTVFFSENENANEDEDKLCVVCLAEPADTLVLPCECSAVCHACSAKLATTPNANTCLKCQRPITEVLQDGQ